MRTMQIKPPNCYIKAAFEAYTKVQLVVMDPAVCLSSKKVF